MKESFWSYLFIVLGIFVIIVMMLVQDLTSTSEEDFYLTREVMEAAMVDSIDYGLYMEEGVIRMIESKFVENFTRRFAESVNDSKGYQIEFYEIYEYPPKATVVVKTTSRSFSVTADSETSFDINTVLSGILETKYGENDENVYVKLNVYNGEVFGRYKYVNYNGSASFDVYPNEHYIVEGSEITCDNPDVKIKTDGDQIIIQGVTRSTSCDASLMYAPHLVTMKLEGGTVVSDKNIYVGVNGDALFKVRAYEEYTLDSPEVTCKNPEGNIVNINLKRQENKYIISNVNTSLDCLVDLRNLPKITLKVYNGTVDIENPFVYSDGKRSFKVIPNSGHTVNGMSVTCDGGADTLLDGDTVNLRNVKSNQTCTIVVP